MRNFLQNLTCSIQRFMQGRYGVDELSKVLFFASVAFVILSYFPMGKWLTFPSLILMIWSYVRCFSKNIYARQKELRAYLNIKNKLSSNISLQKKIWLERKIYRYFKCRKCKALLRVPKGKGKIEITCNICKTKMIKRT